jgi:hydrogenase maturation protease
MPDRSPNTLVLGLGNPILTDDGVGIQVARAVQSRVMLHPSHHDPAEPRAVCGADFAEASVGGLRLLAVLAGYRRVIVVDAIQTSNGLPGTIYQLSPNDVKSSRHAGCTHDLALQGALAWGRQLGMPLPDDDAIVIVAVEAEDVLSFGERCTPAVGAVIPQAAELILGLLQEAGR